MIPDDSESGDDAALFRAAIGTVHTLPKQNRITPKSAPRHAFVPPAAAPVEIADTLSDFPNDALPEAFLANGVSRITLRKLHRNHWPIQDKLDLHGLQSDAARRALQEFLYHAATRQARCVLVIHGKGLNSACGEAVLKIRARHWLMQHPGVLAYCDATPKDGGSGAVLVLLKINL
ncbi:MAG: DNA mismatch repair protein MutS [Gallionella sp.]|nr:DNA mismatch repair protein MutS [Gallionella sp.]